MDQTERCIACDSTRLKATSAAIAPFVRQRTEVVETTTELQTCLACGSRQFRHRFDLAEAGKLYTSYRDAHYLKQRRRFEPWYTAKVNHGFGQHSIERRAAIEQALSMARVTPRGPALDFGGDTGLLFPRSLEQHERWLIDPSQLETSPGIQRARDIAALKDGSLNYVMACQVFEHLSFPGQTLSELTAKMAPGAIFYCEVPDEVSFRDWTLPTALQRSWLSLLLKATPIFTLFDFASVVARHKLKAVPPLGFLKLHEHLQFYSPGGLSELFTRSGFEVLLCRKVHTTAPILQLVAQLPVR